MNHCNVTFSKQKHSIKRNVLYNMKQFLYFILSQLIVSACNTYEYKACYFNSSDEQINIYSNILNELVEQHFYKLYLGKANPQIPLDQDMM